MVLNYWCQDLLEKLDVLKKMKIRRSKYFFFLFFYMISIDFLFAASSNQEETDDSEGNKFPIQKVFSSNSLEDALSKKVTLHEGDSEEEEDSPRKPPVVGKKEIMFQKHRWTSHGRHIFPFHLPTSKRNIPSWPVSTKKEQTQKVVVLKLDLAGVRIKRGLVVSIDLGSDDEEEDVADLEKEGSKFAASAQFGEMRSPLGSLSFRLSPRTSELTAKSKPSDVSDFIETVKFSGTQKVKALLENFLAEKKDAKDSLISAIQIESRKIEALGSDFKYSEEDILQSNRNWKSWLNCKRALQVLGESTAKEDIDRAVAYKNEMIETAHYRLHPDHDYISKQKKAIVFYWGQVALADKEERNELISAYKEGGPMLDRDENLASIWELKEDGIF